MTPTTKLLLKHGVESLIEENEDFFKQNIIQALAIKLNETVNEAKEIVSKDLLYGVHDTADTKELKEFLNFIENFNGGIFTCKDGSNINITESEINELKKLFECLSEKNRQQMVSEIFNNGDTFKAHINFSKKVDQLL